METNENQISELAWPYPRFLLHSLILAGCLSIAMLAYVGLGNWDAVRQENGPLENAQAGVLLVTAIVGTIAAIRSKSPLWSLIALSLAGIALAGWTREMQSCESVSAVGGFCLSRSLKRVIIGSVAVVLAVRWAYALFRQRPSLSPLFSLRFMWSSIPFASCMVLAELAEKADYMLVEEFSELAAYCMLVCVACWILRHPAGSAAAQADPDGASST